MGFLLRRCSVVPSVHLSICPSVLGELHLWLRCLCPGKVGAQSLLCDSKQHQVHRKHTHTQTHTPPRAVESSHFHFRNTDAISPSESFVFQCCCYLLWYFSLIFSFFLLSHWDFLPFLSSSHHFPGLKLTEPPKAVRSDCLILKGRVHRLKWKIWIPLSLPFDSLSFSSSLPPTFSLLPPLLSHCISPSPNTVTHTPVVIFVAFPAPANLTPFLVFRFLNMSGCTLVCLVLSCLLSHF